MVSPCRFSRESRLLERLCLCGVCVCVGGCSRARGLEGH
jgi:hypothetical protein